MVNLPHPKVSISVITYNQKDFLIECLDSCLAQNYPNFEIVIADDGSSDGTPEIALDYQRNYPGVIRFVQSSANSGISKNCNSAWRACSGEWIKTIAGDDKLKPDCLTSFVNEVLKDNGACDAYFSRMTTFDKDGNLNEVDLDLFFYSLSDEDRLKYSLYKNPLPAPTCFIKKSALEEVGFANEKYVMLEDYPLWFNLLLLKKKIKPVDVSTVFYRVGFGVSNGAERICNVLYVRSLHAFRVEKLWPYLGGWALLKKLDDLTYFHQKSIGYKYLGNKKGWLYSVLVLLMAPLRLFSLLLLSNRVFALVIRSTSMR
jgi:glycosyltransferase involved in cell wall biosynthesis